jgi:hypothetical protein
VKTNDEMLQVKALIALLLAEKAEILLRLERAASGIAAAPRTSRESIVSSVGSSDGGAPMDDVVLEPSGRDCA